ncbi:uncharacterized protein LTR77_002522 [Saxophila tyrrhenica]|uniref:Uncharacterized protein n=1 Tax=Saxophila tyrrhenica TaxID=1690608 RepID=A0AAV9PKS5_9PEZI|nr:hypothetical protein LTR77_002522 [Saxophila tyrrhenica]
MAQTMSGQWSNTSPTETYEDLHPSARRQDSNDYSQGKGIRRVPSDAWNIMSDSEELKVRRQSVKATNASAMRKRSRNTLREKKKETPEPVDDTLWIHRDKLAQIEIQEMAAAGIDVSSYRRSVSAGPGASARSSRSQSRSRRPSKDKTAEQGSEEEYNAYSGYEDFERKRISTIPAADEEEQDFNPTVDTEFRTPEEVAAEHGPSSRSNLIRPSTSRIPVSKASPVPVPSNVVDRDSPLPRSRGNSNAWSGNPGWDDMQYARRARSNSIGSQVLLDDDGRRTPPRPGSSNLGSSGENNSPPKSRLPNKATPTSGARKIGTPNGSITSKQRTSVSRETRPVSRGHQSRPSTSRQHAPEGEAPWIASMYKPDPRLPPDQQMLPTHAKRMMQDQWEKEGKAGTAYDRDFRPINDTELPPQKAKALPLTPLSPTSPQLNRLPSDRSNSPSKASAALSPGFQPQSPPSPNSANTNAWPLTPKSETPSSRPGTSGGYKITPTITTPPAIQRTPSAPQGQAQGAQAQPHNPTPRIPDFDEKEEDTGGEKKKGGCGCCVVM